MANWYLLRNGVEFGPFSEDRIIELLATDQLVENDRLKGPGFPQYVPPQIVRERLGVIRDSTVRHSATVNLGSLRFRLLPGTNSVSHLPVWRVVRQISHSVAGTLAQHWAIVGVSACLVVLVILGLFAIRQARMVVARSADKLRAHGPRISGQPERGNGLFGSRSSAAAVTDGTPINEGSHGDSAPASVQGIRNNGSAPTDGSIIYQRAVPAVPRVEPLPPSGSGSGFVVDFNGRWHVVTNRHVVRHAARGVKLTFYRYSDGDLSVSGTFTVPPDAITVVGKRSDIAVISLEGIRHRIRHRIEPLEISTTGPRVGEAVFVIGHPGVPGGEVLQAHFTAGIVSGPVCQLDETAGQAFPMTAAINPGNSGGPVLNGKGQVIGISTFIVRQNEEGIRLESLNFAVDIRELIALLAGKQPKLSQSEMAAFLKELPLARLPDQLASAEELVRLRALGYLKSAFDNGFIPPLGAASIINLDPPTTTLFYLPDWPGEYLLLYFPKVLQPVDRPFIAVFDAYNNYLVPRVTPDHVAVTHAVHWGPARLHCYVSTREPAVMVVLWKPPPPPPPPLPPPPELWDYGYLLLDLPAGTCQRLRERCFYQNLA